MGRPSTGGHITKKGYRRIRVDGKPRMEHVVIWERYHGSIPPTYQVHHKNENKLDNRIENLELLSPLAHKRIHSGCEWRIDQWWKPCRVCGVMRPVTDYYNRPDGISSRCKPCCIQTSVENKQKRKKGLAV